MYLNVLTRIFCSGLLCLLICHRGHAAIQRRKALVMEYFENCGQKVYPATCVNFSFTRNGTVIVLSGEEIITKDTKDLISIQFRMDICKDKANPDTCEYYNTWKWDNLCVMFKVMPFMTPFLNAHEPPLSCPFKKNHYRIKDAKIDTKVVAQFFPRGDSSRVLWKFHVLLQESNQPFACINMAFRIAEVRINS